MTWSLNASGHKDTAAEEARLAIDLHALFGNARHTGYAVMGSQHFGPSIDLTAEQLPAVIIEAAQQLIMSDAETVEAADTGAEPH